MRNEHVWRETTEDGDKREVKAVKFGGAWRLQSKLKTDARWTYHDDPSVADLEALHDLIFRKYQRRRATYEDVKTIEKMLADRRPEPEPGAD
jgi:hypothetical protein